MLTGLRLVGEHLSGLVGTWTLDGDVLRGENGVAVRPASPHSDEPRHLDLEFVLGIDGPDELTVPGCATGVGTDLGAALEQAAQAWVETTGVTVLELLTQRGDFASHFRGDDDGAVAGWHTIVGAISGWGMPPDHEAAQRWMADRLPWAELSPVITAALDRPHLNGVRLFIGGSVEQSTAEVQINGVRDDAASDALLALDWPRPQKMSVARTFLLLVHRDTDD